MKHLIAVLKEFTYPLTIQKPQVTIKESIMKHLITVIAVIIMVANFVSAQAPDTLWTKTYGGSHEEKGYGVQQTSDGGYILTGETYSYSAGHADVYLVKTDTDGDTLWTKHYGGSQIDYGYSVKETIDGGYIVAGFTGSFGPGAYNFYLIKTDNNGDALWTKTYGGQDNDYAYEVHQTLDNGFIIVGETMSYGNGNQVLLVKTDVNGDTTFTKTYGGSGNELGYSVKQTTDGGYIITGGTTSYGYGNTDVWLIKTNSIGDTIWTKTYGGAMGDFGRSVQLTNDNGFIIVGYTNSIGPQTYDYYLVKTNANGDTLWTHTYGNPYVNDYGMSVDQTDDDGYIISGYAYADYTLLYDLYLVRTDALGNIQWTKTLGGNGHDYGYEVQVTSDGGYIVTGSYYNNGYDAWLIRIESDIPPSLIVIELTPYNPPVQIPPGGGSFQFDFQAINQSQINYTIDIWTDVTLLNGSTYPILTRENINLSAGDTLFRPNLTQYVPGSILPGTYTYNAHIRDHNTWEVLAEDSFPFEKLAGDNTPNHNFGWTLLGWDEEIKNNVTLPQKMELSSVYPNPFNNQTAISFTLPEPANIELAIFSIDGRKLYSLLNQEMSAGSHQINFNGQDLSSGIYLYQLKAGSLTQTKKLVLLK